MPFRTAQLIIKKVIPCKWFDGLYRFACGAYDIYQKINDCTFYIPVYIGYKIVGNKEKIKRIETVQKVLEHTLVSKLGVIATYDIVYKASKELDGCFIECGVARGGCSAVMAMIAEDEFYNRKTWLFDSYEGLPPQTDKDGKQKPIRNNNRRRNDLAEGYCLGTWDEVDKFLFVKLKLNRNRVFMIKGWFKDTLPYYKNVVGKIAVLRLDCDWYESTKCCLNNFYGNLVVGGYVIIDDYQLKGCKEAVDEFLVDKPNIKLEYDKNSRVYFQKEE